MAIAESGNPRVQAKTIKHWYKAVLKALIIDFNIKYFSQSNVEHLCLFILRRQSSRMVSVKEHLDVKTVFVFKVEFYTYCSLLIVVYPPVGP